MSKELETTLDEPLLAPHDHTLLLKAVHAHEKAIVAALGSRARLRPLPAQLVLQAVASLPKADDKTRHTARQILPFLKQLVTATLPASYAATLQTVDAALKPAPHPMAVVNALIELRDQRAHEKIPGFQVAVLLALDLIGDALETAGTMMTGISVFGRRRPAVVAKACAHGSVWGALAGNVAGVGAGVGAVAGGVSGTVHAAILAAIEQPR